MPSAGEDRHGQIDQGWLLPDPAPRQAMHTRSIVCRSFLRQDGLIDLDARFIDTRPFDYHSPFRGHCAAGDALHNMQMRLTINSGRQILAVVTVMAATPYAGCAEVNPNFQRLLGLTIGRGFRQAVRERLGGVMGCTHVLALTDAVSAAAMQALASRQHLLRSTQPESAAAPAGKVWQIDALVDSCWSYRADGPVVQRLKSTPDPG